MPDTDRRPQLATSYDQAAEIVAGVKADQLKLPTPCPDFDVSTLVDHIVGAAWRAAELGHGDTPKDAEFPHVELADAPDQIRQAGKSAAEGWSDDNRLANEVTMPWGEVYNGKTLVAMYLAELAAHSWDLAFATGQVDRLTPAVAVDAFAGAKAMMKPEYRNAMGKGIPFGDEVDPPADATDWERFAAFMGRHPRAVSSAA